MTVNIEKFSREIFKCTACDYEFNSEVEANKHLIVHTCTHRWEDWGASMSVAHAAGYHYIERSFICKICNKTIYKEARIPEREVKEYKMEYISGLLIEHWDKIIDCSELEKLDGTLYETLILHKDT